MTQIQQIQFTNKRTMLCLQWLQPVVNKGNIVALNSKSFSDSNEYSNIRSCNKRLR
jgi:hypothetical protein